MCGAHQAIDVRQETEWKIHLRQSAATRLVAWIERKIWNLRFYSPSEDLFLLHWTFIRFSCENKYLLTRIYLLRRRLAVAQVTTATRFQYAAGRITESQWIVVSNWRRTEINSVNKYLYKDESHCAISDKCFPTIRTTVDRFMAHFGASLFQPDDKCIYCDPENRFIPAFSSALFNAV